jgi:hypothetical protein
MEWERGETPPGRTISTLKTGGLRTLLEDLAAAAAPASAERDADADRAGSAGPDAEAWTPVV